jgi:hypothetical protein
MPPPSNVVAVADVGQLEAVEAAERLTHREQVGERLARMVTGREHVHDRHGALLSELVENRIGAGADADGRHVTREHASGVAGRLTARELQLVAAEHERVAAEFVNADVERDAGARGRLLEDQRHGPAGEDLRGPRISLQLRRAIQDRVHVGT